MTALQRRFYLLFFVALFLVTAPILVLFAQGYRFDQTGRIFVYSGSITIKSWPRDIDVFIDGKKREKKNLNVINNSYTINGVRPGVHTIECRKDGYTSWSKEIDVHSGVSTEFWNVILFPLTNRDISTFNTSQLNQFFISPRQENEIIYFSNNQHERVVSLLDIYSNESQDIFTTSELDFLDPGEKENVEWSSDNKRILIPLTDGSKKTYIIARVRKENLQDVVDFNHLFNEQHVSETGSPLIVPSKTSKNKQDYHFKKVRWMFDKNDELVALTTDHELYYLNIEKPEEKILIDSQVSGFDFSGNRIYYSQLPNNTVWEIKDNDLGTKRQITKEPIATAEDEFVTMTAYDQYRITIETADEDLYLFNEEKEKGEISMDKIAQGAKGMQFSDDGKKLLYWTNNEIWTIFLREWKVQPIRQKGDRIFITRFSAPVQNVQWMDDYENVLFSIGSSVKSANIDTRWGTDIVDVYDANNDLAQRDMFYDKEDQILYCRTSGDGTNGLETIQLIDKGFLGR